MRRDSEEIEEVAFPQVHNDSVPKRNHHSFVRDVNSRGMLSATLFSLEHVGLFLCTNPKEGCAWYWMRDDRTPTFCLLLVCDRCVPKGSDESKSPCLKVWMWILRRRLNCGTHFPSRLPTTDVRDCFHWFRMLLSLSRFLLSQSSSLTCVLNDWRHARGTGGWRRILPSGHVGEYSPWASLGRCFCPRVAMKTRPASHPACVVQAANRPHS